VEGGSREDYMRGAWDMGVFPKDKACITWVRRLAWDPFILYLRRF
jgi:hypothetical protein